MAETNTNTINKPKAKPAVGTTEAPKFTAPGFDAPKFDMPKFEVPAPFREFAEKGAAQAKDNWDKMKAATEEASDVLEDSYAKASKGAADYGLKVIEVTRTNANAAFDFYARLLGVKTASEAVELSTAFARKQFDASSAQTKELTALAQKVAADTAEPLKEGFSAAFKKVA
jgi:phasin